MSEQAEHKRAPAVGPVIVVFGITGDLSKRKLLPALYHLLSQDLLPANTKLVGTSRHPLDSQEFLKTVELCVLEKDNVCDPAGLKKVESALTTLQLDPDKADDYRQLAQLLQDFDQPHQRQRLFYLSVPASAYPPIVQHLAAACLNQEHDRLLLEKPFGQDVDSAQNLIGLLGEHFDESQTYRIDHYLAKETAQNVLAFRLHNPIFNALWDGQYIQRVHIRALEKLGVEGRAGFYEQTGALRDIIQSHLLQLLAITLMEMPADMDSDAIHHSKAYFLEQLIPADPAQAERAQYEGYREEVKHPNSTTETYAQLHLRHDSERWRDTDIILETGKAMTEKTTDITIEFKTPHERRRNSLTFQIQPNEGISLDLVVKEPGLENRMRHAELDFRYEQTFGEAANIDAYERVLMDALRGDQSLFASDREVLATWRVLQPVLSAWQDNAHGLKTYHPGSPDL